MVCVDSGGKQVDAKQCPGGKPPTTQRCNTRACDFCSSTSCFGRGTCTAGACACDPASEFSGQYCEVPSGCAGGIVDSQLQCCASGVVSATGACCPPGAVLDARGECCAAGVLDACGVCGGKGKHMDVQGSCCETMLDANGVCCEVGACRWCPVPASMQPRGGAR